MHGAMECVAAWCASPRGAAAPRRPRRPRRLQCGRSAHPRHRAYDPRRPRRQSHPPPGSRLVTASTRCSSGETANAIAARELGRRRICQAKILDRQTREPLRDRDLIIVGQVLLLPVAPVAGDVAPSTPSVTEDPASNPARPAELPELPDWPAGVEDHTSRPAHTCARATRHDRECRRAPHHHPPHSVESRLERSGDELAVRHQGETIPSRLAPPRAGQCCASCRSELALERIASGLGPSGGPPARRRTRLRPTATIVNAAAPTVLRSPTASQAARWKAIQQALLQGLSMRATARLLGISRNTIMDWYVRAGGPPGRQGAALIYEQRPPRWTCSLNR